MFKSQSVLLEDIAADDMLPLDTFPAPMAGEEEESGIIRILMPEFTCVCPKTGYPDFASIHLYYKPDQVCLELKAWKLYLNSFRNIGTFHETFTYYIFKKLKEVLKPKWMMVVGDFLPRGNVDTTVVFETVEPRPKEADVLVGTVPALCQTFKI